MPRDERNKTMTERLYRNHVLPFGSLGKVGIADVLNQKLEDPPFDDEEQKKGT